MNDDAAVANAHALVRGPGAILPPRLSQWSGAFLQGWALHQVDPLLLAAICDRESGGGLFLKPVGPAGTGDGGHGRGLMQIDDRSHMDWLSQTDVTGTPLWQIPEQNVAYAAGLLGRLLDLFNGHFADPSDQLSTHCAVAAYNCGEGAVIRALNSCDADTSVFGRITAVDSRTTGHDYSQNVLSRYGVFAARVQSNNSGTTP